MILSHPAGAVFRACASKRDFGLFVAHGDASFRLRNVPPQLGPGATRPACPAPRIDGRPSAGPAGAQGGQLAGSRSARPRPSLWSRSIPHCARRHRWRFGRGPSFPVGWRVPTRSALRLPRPRLRSHRTRSAPTWRHGAAWERTRGGSRAPVASACPPNRACSGAFPAPGLDSRCAVESRSPQPGAKPGPTPCPTGQRQDLNEGVFHIAANASCQTDPGTAPRFHRGPRIPLPRSIDGETGCPRRNQDAERPYPSSSPLVRPTREFGGPLPDGPSPGGRRGC